MKLLLIFSLLLIYSGSIVFAQETKNNSAPSKKVTDYDFTTSKAKYYGNSAGAKEIETGIWGMAAGDANDSDIISFSDKDSINSKLNSTGYYFGDTNIDGTVTKEDKFLIKININHFSRLPKQKKK